MVNVSRDDYHIVLKCYLELSCLYLKAWKNYQESMKQCIDALELYRNDDVDNLFECYKCLANTFEKQYLEQTSDSAPTPSPSSFHRTSIFPVVRTIIENFIDRADWKTVIILFEHLIQTILKEHNDHLGVDKEFQKVLDICKNLDDSISVETYSSYLEIMLRYRCISHHAQLSAIEPPFCQVLSIYKAYNNTRRVICTYRKFLELIISTITNYATFVDAVQHLALDLETVQLVNEALGMHMRFARFILTCNTKETILKVGFIIVRYRLLAKNGAQFNINYQQAIIELMKHYRNIVESRFIIDDFLKTLKT
ncbi:unnamed protein product [Adineta ricciae]|uniref:Uncharacterized protein n=1 Tax=Adineta ricciae TaxID=249248 RepID=A0A816E7T3_ADIRI|nr:unnamed protein product [Adineta ricciae]CAF1643227.1 unnamed protein product [Adineta ricciae]